MVLTNHGKSLHLDREDLGLTGAIYSSRFTGVLDGRNVEYIIGTDRLLVDQRGDTYRHAAKAEALTRGIAALDWGGA